MENKEKIKEEIEKRRNKVVILKHKFGEKKDAILSFPFCEFCGYTGFTIQGNEEFCPECQLIVNVLEGKLKAIEETEKEYKRKIEEFKKAIEFLLDSCDEEGEYQLNEGDYNEIFDEINKILENVK